MDLSKNFYLKIVFVFVISLAYAIIRYNVFGNVPWDELPLYITNKAISLSAILLLFFSVIQKKARKQTSKNIWKIIFIFTLIHIFISFRLFGPEHYQKFYFENALNLVGYITLFFGITAFSGFLILNSDNLLLVNKSKLTIPTSLKKRSRKLIPYLLAGHLIAMGINGWISPNSWPGFFVPISLIAFVFIVIYMVKIKRK
jgi:hypothetical protein